MHFQSLNLQKSVPSQECTHLQVINIQKFNSILHVSTINLYHIHHSSFKYTFHEVHLIFETMPTYIYQYDLH